MLLLTTYVYFSLNIDEIVYDIIDQIVKSEKAMSLAVKNTGDILEPAQSTPLPEVKNVNGLKDLTSADGAELLVSIFFKFLSGCRSVSVFLLT